MLGIYEQGELCCWCFLYLTSYTEIATCQITSKEVVKWLESNITRNRTAPNDGLSRNSQEKYSFPRTPYKLSSMMHFIKLLLLATLLPLSILFAEDDQMIPVSDPNLLEGLSPLNWIRTKDGIHSSVGGASINVQFEGTKNVALRVDSSAIRVAKASRFPVIAWSVNGGPVVTHQLSAEEASISIAKNTEDPKIEIFLKGFSPFEDRFHGDVPVNAVTIRGFSVDAGGSIAVAKAVPKIWWNIGDSILSGDAAAYAKDQGRPPDDLWAASNDAHSSYGFLLAKHFGYRESRLAFGGYAWTGGGGNNPSVSNLIDQLTSTTTRLTEGKLQPSPDVVLINLGENARPPADQVISALEKIRLRCQASTKLIVMIPISGRARNEVTMAVKAYHEKSNDKLCYLVDLGQIDFETVDGQHPTAAGHRTVYEMALPQFQKILSEE